MRMNGIGGVLLTSALLTKVLFTACWTGLVLQFGNGVVRAEVRLPSIF
jgi:hypothetical protein